MALKVRKGDTVQVTTGKDRGKKGHILRVLPQEQRVVVEGVNVVKRHRRQRPGLRQAGIVSMEAPVNLSSVMLVCPRCNAPARMGLLFLEGGKKKVRICKKCKETID